VRDLEEIALENAVEGCVRETFAGVAATYKAAHAGDAGIAAAMRIIAQDETRHAALAWDVAAWLDGKLSKRRGRGRAAQRAAVQQVLQRRAKWNRAGAGSGASVCSGGRADLPRDWLRAFGRERRASSKKTTRRRTV